MFSSRNVVALHEKLRIAYLILDHQDKCALCTSFSSKEDCFPWLKLIEAYDNVT